MVFQNIGKPRRYRPILPAPHRRASHPSLATQALDGTLDEFLHFIGRLAEIDRRIAALTPIEFTDHGASETRTAKRGDR
jgi:hypothetical protein